jgi:hypothetical protein
MATPTYFTIEGDYRSVVADIVDDADYDPQQGPVSATVTFTPQLKVGDVILAITADPRPIGYIPAPIVGRIDVDGQVKLRVDVDYSAAAPGDVLHYANLAAFPGTGSKSKVYIADDTDIKYVWNGARYVNFTPVRLLADTPMLGLTGQLIYEVKFTNVTFNAKPGIINSFFIAARTTDSVLNIITEGRVPGTTGQGITRGSPGAPVDDVALVGDDVQFYVQGQPIGDPLALDVTGVPVDMDDITDATTVGKAVTRSPNTAAARTAIGLGNVDNTSDATKNVLSATKLTTARTINGVAFDGTANITVADATKIAKNTVVNVKDYGAVGDNSTNDSAAFTAALNAAKSATLTGSTATVFVPSGFYVTGPLTLANRVVIRGERGVGTSRLRLKSGSTAPLITNETNARMVGVYDLYLDGGKFNGVSSANAHGIVFDHSAALTTDPANSIAEWADGRSVISNVFIQYCKGTGIKTLGRALCRVSDVQMFLCDGHGLDIGGPDSDFSNINVGASGKDGFYIHSTDNRFTNCYAWYSGAVDTDGGLTNGTGHGFHIDSVGASPNVYSSCVAQDNMRAGFYLDSAARQAFAACSADSNNRANLSHCGVEINGSGGNSWDGIITDRGANTFHQLAGLRLIGSTVDNKVSALVSLANMTEGALSSNSFVGGNTVFLGDGAARKHSFAGAIAYRLVSDAGASLTLTTGATVWEFTGTTATWTLPTRTGNSGVPLVLQNRGSGVLTVQRAGSEAIYTDSAVTSVTVNPGQTLKLISDGTYWVAFRPPVAGRLATAQTINGVAFDGTAPVPLRAVVTVTTATTLAAAANEYLVRIQAGGTPTLPTAVGNTSTYILKNEDAADHNVPTTSSQTIEGFASPFVLPPGQSIKVYSDNANWRQF